MSPDVLAIYSQTVVTAAVTLIVGLGVFGVYLWQKIDHKKTIARIILIEIENAEGQLVAIKGNESDSLPENTLLMPTSSWEKYRHLLGRDFSSREWDTVSDFYNRCSRYDKAINYDGSSLEHDIEAFRTSVNGALAFGLAVTILGDTSVMSDDELDGQYVEFRRRVTNTFMKPENLFLYKPNKPLYEATKAIKDLNGTLSLTSVGDKLRKISKPNIWQRIFSKHN
ncbi:MAG: hypothetical protein ABIQ04_00310 [Candidatus Saccharimonadales bacterium]